MADKPLPAPVRVAVIDSGVQTGHPHIAADRLEPGFAVLRDGSRFDGEEATKDMLGHGTAVTAAIQQWAPDALCLPVRVFHDALRASPRALVSAIDHSIAAGVALINLSLGTANELHCDALRGAARRALDAGVVMISAFEANDAPCYPGALSEVLGVRLDWDCPRNICRAGHAGLLPLHASGYPRPIDGVPQRRNLYGVSFAVANVTGMAAHALAATAVRVDGLARVEDVGRHAAGIPIGNVPEVPAP